MTAANDFDTITPEDLARRLESDSPPVLLDVHIRDRFADVHIPGAANAPVFEVVFLDEVGKIVEDEQAEVVVCGTRDGTAEAAMAADKLTRAGYGRVSILAGGLEGWRASGRPLEGADPEAEAAPAVLPDGEFEMDLDACAIEWEGRNPSTTHDGTVPVSSGTLTVAEDRLSGRFEIDLTHIRNRSLEGNDLQSVLIAHLESDDFFFTKRFPKAVFELTRGEPVEGATKTELNYAIEGKLTLRGITADLEFAANVVTLADGKIAAEAHFDIDRTQWGVVYGSAGFFDHLGMHLVFDLISLRLRLKTR